MKRLFVVALLAGLVLPVSAQQKFDPSYLLNHTQMLSSDAFGGRGTGSPGGRRAMRYIQNVYRGVLGLYAFEGNRVPNGDSLDAYLQPFRLTDRSGESMVAANILGYLPGTAHPDSFIVITAHYDHLGTRDGQIYNGADDNASGVAGMMAAAYYFRHHPPRHSILFAALDAEEIGLKGAEAFVTNPPVPLSQVVLNVNLDMISRNDRDELYASGTHHYPYLRPYLEQAASRSKIHLKLGHDTPGTGREDWTSASDHAWFHRKGIPYVYFGVEDHAGYHTPEDDFDRITPGFFIRAVDTIIDAVILFDEHLADIARHRSDS